MFRRILDTDIDTGSETVTITIEGKAITAPIGETVAAAMLAAGVEYARTTPVSGAHRAPYCMMGACFDCLVEIDGIPNQQACQTMVREGMCIKLQRGARDIDS